MSKTVVINNTSFNIPDPGDENYGEELSSYLEELATVINGISSALDILKTDFNFTNNQVSVSPVVGFSFPTSNIASFVADYVITRSDGVDKVVESGKLSGFQDDTGWRLSRYDVDNNVTSAVSAKLPTATEGDIGIVFDINAGGQITYTSNNFVGQTIGIITFKAKAVEQ